MAHVKQAHLADFRPPIPTKDVSRVLLDPRLADLFRRLCAHLRRPANAVFEEMMALYIQERTDLEPVFVPTAVPEDAGPLGPEPERRSGSERRGTKPDIGRPSSVSDRRRKPRRAS